ncbi:hypothetical protein [Halomicrobium sp. LC1Hm]|uniref:hypothetical protein n=1 Tax=Halomicrobium sp. LC1Hm TaxID=2610902 RepID=UPI0012983280|nr:hypothetical protein [Halomicrobium sp. LC1Hm]QGA81998.1 hypothetical protein LC1Hm_0936 [Halomicrobium sp. LC1Hm]
MGVEDFDDGDEIWLNFDADEFTQQMGEVVGVNPDLGEIDVQLASIGHKDGSNTEENFLIDLVTIDVERNPPHAHGETVNQNTESMGTLSISHVDR